MARRRRALMTGWGAIGSLMVVVSWSNGDCNRVVRKSQIDATASRCGLT